ncbi:hypothetical protein D3C87_287820 [compost metagenome]
MSGFLHQLARRSLGLAPRMRSAPASPLMSPRNAGAQDEAWPDTVPASGAAHSAALETPESASGLMALDTWARAQARLAPQQGSGTAPAHTGPHRRTDPAPAAAGIHATESAPAAFQPAAERTSAAPFSSAPPRRDASLAAMREQAATLDAERRIPPSVTRVDAARADTPGDVPAANDAADARAASRPGTPAWMPPDTRALPARTHGPDRRPAPDVHITIDRLEVAPPAPLPRAAPPARSAALSLRAYLSTRRSGQP